MTPMLSSGYLNTEDNTLVGKTATGSVVNFPAQSYLGQLGKLLVVDDAEALRLSKTTIGILRAGAYALVQTKAGSTAAPARGLGAFWDINANNGVGKSVVTPDMAATSVLAGYYISAPTKGNYCWIQVAGLATLQFRATVTSKVAGNLVVFTGLTTNTFDAIADATDYFTTAGAYKTVVGQAQEAPTDAGLTQVFIQKAGKLYF